MASATRGAFIVIEGLDRSGKSTQASILLTHLQTSTYQNASSTQTNPSAVLIKFPDRTTAIGKMIDKYLRSEVDLDDRTIHLLFSANRWELASTITTHLSSGTTVIADRYAFSGIAFSAHKGLPYEWCRAPDVGLPAPDLTLFLDISPQDAQGRGGYGRERYETEHVQRGVRAVFERIGWEMVSGGGAGKWVVVDAGRDRERVAADVWTAVQDAQRVLRETSGPVKRLWETLGCGEIQSEGDVSI